MRKFVFFIFTFMLFGLFACKGEQAQSNTTKFISVNGYGMVDSSLVFTFEGDSILYVDDYKSGCGLESYSIEVEHRDDYKTVYKAKKFVSEVDLSDSVNIHHIEVIRLVMNHWQDYYLKFIFDSTFSYNPHCDYTLTKAILIEPNKTIDDI